MTTWGVIEKSLAEPSSNHELFGGSLFHQIAARERPYQIFMSDEASELQNLLNHFDEEGNWPLPEMPVRRSIHYSSIGLFIQPNGRASNNSHFFEEVRLGSISYGFASSNESP